MSWILVILAAVLAAIPAGMFLVNLFLYRPPRKAARVEKDLLPAVSILIPARNEEDSIASSLESILAQRDAILEVVVLDDHSEDETANIVRSFAKRDSRVRLEQAPALPPGWCGKQFACWTLSGKARYDRFLFLDADVRLRPSSLVRLLHAMEHHQSDLLSGIPQQITGSFLDRLLLPLIHFVLLGFLPMPAMRLSRDPKFAAGCGQLMLVRRQAYMNCEGHAAIRDSLHDGLKLPRAFRKIGAKTDLTDATDLAECRMYANSRDTWAGLSKNATEGLAAPGVLLPMTILMIGGQILPFLLLCFWSVLPTASHPWLIAAVACAWMPRWICCIRYRQPWLSALVHPLGILVLLALQWRASWQQSRGKAMEWKGRAYPSVPPPSEPQAKAGAQLLPIIRKSLFWWAPLVALISFGSSLNAQSQNPIPPVQTALTARLTSFELSDQYGEVHKIKFPSSKLVLLLAADRQGSNDIESWLPHIRRDYPLTNRPFLLLGMADVSAVPTLLKPLVQRKFKKVHGYPVLMDWNGTIINQFKPKAKTANLYLIRNSGEVVHCFSGKAADEPWKTLQNAIANHANSE